MGKAGKVYERAETMDQAFQECQHLLEGSILGFTKRRGGDIEENRSRAYNSFIAAYNGHNPEKSSFGARVIYYANCDMLTGLEFDHQLRKLEHQLPEGDVLPIPHKSQFDLAAFIAERSEDAKVVLSLLFDMPQSTSPSSGQKIRQRIYSMLGELGWCGSRIVESFCEIHDALFS